MNVIEFPTMKEVREQIETLCHCQAQTNETLVKITEALQALTVWMAQKERLEVENNEKIELIMKAIRYSSPA